MVYFLQLLSYLAKRHNSNRFGSQSGQEQIRSSNWPSSNLNVNLVVVDALNALRLGLVRSMRYVCVKN